jgi:hypothetical protein
MASIDAHTIKVLQSLRRELMHELRPELGDQGAQAKADMLGTILGFLAEDLDNPRAEEESFEAEFARLTGEPANVAASLEAANTQIVDQEVEASAERMDAFFAEQMGGGKTQNISRITGGFSKDSFFLDYLDRDGTLIETVLRRDMPFGPADNTVLDEYALLEKLFPHDVGVARPVICEASTKFIGQPFILSERVKGIDRYDEKEDDKAKLADVWGQLANLVARLHSLDPEKSELKVAKNPQDQLHAYVKQWEDQWQRYKVEDSAILSAGFAWLYDNLPSQIERISVVHADIGFHNVLVDEGKITALLILAIQLKILDTSVNLCRTMRIGPGSCGNIRLQAALNIAKKMPASMKSGVHCAMRFAA